jgi:hypothetical protein
MSPSASNYHKTLQTRVLLVPSQPLRLGRRFLHDGRHAELLDLPPQFDSQLQQFLSDQSAPDAAERQRLRWLHELRTGNYGGATATLAANLAADVAAAQQAQQAPVQQQQQEDGEEAAAQLRRTAALTKLAALAACPLWPLAVDDAAMQHVAAAEGVLADQGAGVSIF